jgi:hypothetical protein
LNLKTALTQQYTSKNSIYFPLALMEAASFFKAIFLSLKKRYSVQQESLSPKKETIIRS